MNHFQQPGTCFISLSDPKADQEVHQQLMNHGMKDLQTFLLARKRELQVGGFLVFNCLGYETLFPTQEEEEIQKELFRKQLKEEGGKNSQSAPEEDISLIVKAGLRLFPIVHRQLKQINVLLEKTRKHFNITLSEEDGVKCFSFIPRSVEDILFAINSHSELAKCYEVQFCTLDSFPDPYWVKYLSGEFDDDTWVRNTHAHIRAWSESSIRELLKKNEEAVHYFYDLMFAAIAEQEKVDFGIDFTHILCCLKKVA